ncbi:MAG: flagellin [candidate division Zixibacteria bacterium]
MIINSYVNSLGSLNNLIQSNKDLGKTFEKLSSGLKINTASDDPAGLVISIQLRSAIAGISQQIENLEQHFNKYSTAEGYLASMQSNLQEMRDVALASANEGTTTEEMRAAYQNILDRNIEGYNRAIETASYGSISLLDGSSGSVANLAPLAGLDITDSQGAEAAVNAIDTQMNELLNLRAEIGTTQKYEFQSQSDNLHNQLINLTQSESAIRDTDMAQEFVDMIRAKIQREAQMLFLAHNQQMTESVMKILSG